MSKISGASHNLLLTAATLAASAALLTGCGDKQPTAEQKEQESTQAAYRYENSSGRNGRITAAVARFVKVVINQESLPNSKWGHIDLYCTSNTNAYGNEVGFAPLREVKAGDDCRFSVGDSNGPLWVGVGTDSLGVSGDHGSFDTNKVSDLTVNRLGNAGCSVSFLYTSEEGWLANPTNGPASWPSSVYQVKHTDDQSLNCLDATLATLK